jgi:hypothetical protein
MKRADQNSLFLEYLREHAGILRRVARTFASPADQADRFPLRFEAIHVQSCRRFRQPVCNGGRCQRDHSMAAISAWFLEQTLDLFGFNLNTRPVSPASATHFKAHDRAD